ncbi:hypothetical protein FRB95_013795 [Tulasnella sp. JGI-2019a]|nr:hypothetical protein FRB95_013795 [Tulasnella sp. JGI-2019a]
MKVFAIGASRNIGYYSALRLLQEGHHVVYLLRKTSVFDSNEEMKPFIESGLAELVQGDALSWDDGTRAWAQATLDGPVDVVLFSLGLMASISIFPLGFVLDPPNACTNALLNIFATFPNTTSTTQPRFVIISAFGSTKASKASVPFLMKPLYYMLKGPHADKTGMEEVCAYSAGWPDEHKATKEILPAGWEGRLKHGRGWLKHAVVIRPGIFTDGEVTGKYRVGDDQMHGVYMISRKDIAHFIVTDLLPNWEKYGGRGISIAN